MSKKRRIFISFHHKDRGQVRGFRGLSNLKGVNVDFVGRHLLEPVDSTNKPYIRQKVREQLKGTSVTVVLLGNGTYDRDWVRWEIEESVEKGNGILAICLKDKDPLLPSDSPVGEALEEAGAEIMDWDPDAFNAAIERAFEAAGRAEAIQTQGTSSDSCAR